MKSSQLIAALEEGKLLEKDYKIAYPDEYQFYEEGDHVQYLFLYTAPEAIGINYYEAKGWGSYGNVEDRIAEIARVPCRWRVSKHSVDDRPWSIDFKNKTNDIQNIETQDNP